VEELLALVEPTERVLLTLVDGEGELVVLGHGVTLSPWLKGGYGATADMHVDARRLGKPLQDGGE